ncbi:hypothetical protein [Patulibacter sp.]|uniref:hypothetical protein n=1 Tax=Patulibacter sp. TaxID=1912859 RepID=UPI002718A0CE|nr:hypothetical protein [Patulibacter sp.]MDO9408313.1 hypothetical protein [Patulibacter sp.]
MGGAEQRQVASGAAARVREQAERVRRLDGRLAEIRRHRVELDDARRFALGHESGLRAAVGLAVLDADPPTDEQIARAAGWSVGDVEAHRARLRR